MAITEDTIALEAHFDQIRETYNLNNISYENLGQDGASVKIEINPTRRVPINDSEALRVEADGRIGDSDWVVNPEVDFTTQTVTIGDVSDTAGRKMTAHWLAAGHPAGAEASTSTDQNDTFIEKLPSGRQGTGATNKYVRGHLLNANIGGPASGDNLFPITDQANRQHKSWVEAYIKEEVATGYVGRYEVSATKGRSRKINNRPLYYLNATFLCTYRRLNAKFDPIGRPVEITINSIYGQSGEAVDHRDAWKGLYGESDEAAPDVLEGYERSERGRFGEISDSEKED